jgi:hypothetical protein
MEHSMATILTSESLSKLASAAVRIINKENGISLKKKVQYISSDAAQGAAVYFDADHDEYRVLFFKDGAHVVNADYHTQDFEDACDSSATTIENNVAHVSRLAAVGQRMATQAQLASGDIFSAEEVQATGLGFRHKSRNQREGRYRGKLNGMHWRDNHAV